MPLGPKSVNGRPWSLKNLGDRIILRVPKAVGLKIKIGGACLATTIKNGLAAWIVDLEIKWDWGIVGL